MSGVIRQERRVSALELLPTPVEPSIDSEADAEKDLLTSDSARNDGEQPGTRQSMLRNSQNLPSTQQIFKIVVTPKRLQHFGFDPSCDCWCCNKDLRFWCTVIGPFHVILFLIYAIALYVSYDLDRFDATVGMKIVAQPDQKPIINYRKGKFPHFLVATSLMGGASVASGLLIFVGARQKWRLLLYLYVVVTLILEASLAWAILLTWSPYLSALFLLGILLNVYFQIASVTLDVHIKWGYYDAEMPDDMKVWESHSNDDPRVRDRD